MRRLSDEALQKLVKSVCRENITQCVALPTDIPARTRVGMLERAVREGPMSRGEKLREIEKAELRKGPRPD